MYPYPQSGAEPVLLQIGDMALTSTHVILPHGQYPLHGATWTVHDSTQVTESISTAGIILTVVFVWFCLLGLLFLLMKETRYLGFVSISVTGPGFHHTAQFPPGPQSSAWAAQAIAQARAITAAAPPLA
ncbi:hypothetical protein [Actinomadura sp. 6K520]|uniref:hypothetical protein n=1 Tax=Actinomadura sp. 6K520 TaxID=2530364 RepID=UPI001A9E153F|nr:hypothetical protein [Actinomadura sp. 6K520]